MDREAAPPATAEPDPRTAPERSASRRGKTAGATIPGASTGGATTACATARDGTDNCVHCGLPLTGEQKRRGDVFCCRGCESVYGLIHEHGLERYYELRPKTTAPPAALRPDSFAWLDRLLAASPPDIAGMPGQLTLDILGVHCAACIWLLQTLYRRHPGGLDIRINPALGKVDLVWDPSRLDLRDFLAEAGRFGYRFGPSRKATHAGSRDLAVRLGICIAAAMNTMIFTLTYYLGLTPADGALYPFFGWINLTLAVISVAAGGTVFIRSAIAGLGRGIVHLDVPIALGITLAFAGSVYAFATTGPRAAYFDTVTIFVALMLVGRWLQERVLERNRNALLGADEAEGLVARRYREGRLGAIPVTEIDPGDEIWVVPGDLVPVEGELLAGSGALSLDWITGESEVLAVPAGERIPAGAFNAGEMTLRLRAGEGFESSRLQDLLRSPRAADGERAGKPGGDRWWRRVSTGWVIAVLVLAAGGFALWSGHGVPRALEVAIAILVVSCPCALGLATPLAQEMTHLALRRSGVFLRTTSFLDKALSVRKVIFDKTGTLTLGRLVLAPDSRRVLREMDARHRDVLHRMVVRSNHPVSRAVAEALAGLVDGRVAGDEGIVERPGVGLRWDHDGQTFRFGRRVNGSTIGDDGPADEPAAGASGSAAANGAGAIVSSFTAGEREVAALELLEEIRLDAPGEIARLRAAGLEIHLLSGDRPEKVAAAAAALGIEPAKTHAGLAPEEKAAYIRRLDRHDTLMVGDGLNDGPSFDAALCAATPAIDRPALPARADFYFLGEGIAAVRRALEAARHLRRVVRGNLVVTGAYNLGALALCYAGRVDPLLAAVLMPISSITVVALTTWRLTGRRLTWKY